MSLQLAVATGCCVNQSILTTLTGFHEAGVTAVELGTPPRHFDLLDPGQVTAVAERVQHFGMTSISIHAPFGGMLELSDPNPHHRQAAIGAVLTAASTLREIGGSRVIVHVTDVIREDQNVDARLHCCVESLQVLARACGQMGAWLIVETPLPHLIGGHPDEFAWLLGHLDRSVGVCVDTGHAMLGHHWDRFIEVAGDRLVHVHANDNRGRFDEHLPPGEGVIDWLHVRETLRHVGFNGWVVLELACPNGPLPGYIGHAIERVRQLLD